MEIPKTTPSEPYIEFRFDHHGKLTLNTTSSWYGGKRHSFICSDGSSGNTCLPKDLKAYIKAFHEINIKDLEKEIKTLQKKLEKLKIETIKIYEFLPENIK